MGKNKIIISDPGDEVESIYLEEISEERLLRHSPTAPRQAARRFLPLVCRGPVERHAGHDPPAGGLYRRVAARPADPVRQTGVRLFQPGAFRSR